MTIKVLREGEKPGEEIYRGNCTVCGGEFEWSKGDGHTPDGTVVSMLECPTLGCGHQVMGYRATTAPRPTR